MPKLRLVLDTHRKNIRFTQYDPEVVLMPLDHAATLVEAFHQQKATIDSDRHLTPEGKVAARIKAANATLAALKAWYEPRLKGIDADLLEQKAGLIPDAKMPDPTRVALMSADLLKFTPHERAVLYGSASEDEKRVMEAASAATGRVPTKTGNALDWTPLLNAEVVNESIMARAAATNPAAVAKVQELTEIRQMTVSIAGVAASEIRDALPEYKLEG